MTGGGPRLFVAVAPPTALVAPLFEEARASLAPAVGWLRFPRPDGLHVTLEFLGSLDDRAREQVSRALETLGPLTAPRLELGTGSAFPRRGSERVLWLGMRPEVGQEQVLERLASEVRGVVREALSSEAPGPEPGPDSGTGAPWRPHLTVARVNPRRRPRGELIPDGFWHLAGRAAWTPDELLLMQSLREGPGPPRYTAVGRWPLGPSRS